MYVTATGSGPGAEYFPPGQSGQEYWPELFWYLAAGQSVHDSEAAAEYVPELQLVHAAAAVAAEYLPRGHALHVAWPTVLNEVGKQSVQVAAAVV